LVVTYLLTKPGMRRQLVSIIGEQGTVVPASRTSEQAFEATLLLPSMSAGDAGVDTIQHGRSPESRVCRTVAFVNFLYSIATRLKVYT